MEIAGIWLPIHDPFVIFGIVLLSLLIVIAIFLLTITQRRSAREVWNSVGSGRQNRSSRKSTDIDLEQAASDTDSLIESSRVMEDTERLVSATQLSAIQLDTIPREPLPGQTHVAKSVRFSSDVDSYSADITDKSFDDAVDNHRRSNNWDIEAGPSNRRSMSQQQSAELHVKSEWTVVEYHECSIVETHQANAMRENGSKSRESLKQQIESTVRMV